MAGSCQVGFGKSIVPGLAQKQPAADVVRRTRQKALLLASQGKVSRKPLLSFQFYIHPSPFFTLKKKRVNTVN
ncbi:hypothetical protein CTZ24_13585 [Pantoea phytobeneficialis]|uniref:Uncharacterized protein n=1 Tax=Pantoea phytobeneficialis TaxID=2052056 RepID=A0AAP9H6T4_9GAMM|nr:hypothetical protein CTZ24_13585 [Pantoea phytobeneficialis]